MSSTADAPRHELLHPDGRCTCAGEGWCRWCRTHCCLCGVRVPYSGEGCPVCQGCTVPPIDEDATVDAEPFLRWLEGAGPCPWPEPLDEPAALGQPAGMGYDYKREWLDKFDYQTPDPAKVPRFEKARAACKAAAEVLVAQCPPGADLTAALRHLHEGQMTAIKAIVFDPQNDPPAPGGE